MNQEDRLKQGFPVEYIREKNDTKSADPVKFVPNMGSITFTPHRDFGNRAVVFFPDRESVRVFLAANNPPGRHPFREPADIMSRIEEARIQHKIDVAIAALLNGPLEQRLATLEQEVTNLRAARRPGRPRREQPTKEEASEEETKNDESST
uniref:Uncharacterized protein n=1 Tax=viral metagenome TaxID=1070528 RepID=A0A6M3IZM4_9ZZZZ